uniref:RING-type E3 ubiquitin transferase n=1 Tax=Oryza meridionalis TaxID=40149 RepID=A0A0E0EP51_9ORYZ
MKTEYLRESMGSALSGSCSGSLLVLSVSVVGILFTSILLLAYYLFLAFSWRRHSHQTAPTPPLPSFFLATSTATDQPRRGLEEAAICRIPTLRYHHHQQQCGVCLGDFREGERLRRLPPCLHSFHIDCIDAWLATALTCPLCRAHVHIAAATSTRHDDDQLLSGVHQPMRRSLSLDSCQLSDSHTRTRTRREPKPAVSESERPSRTLRRSFFSFSHTTTSPVPTPILPI